MYRSAVTLALTGGCLVPTTRRLVDNRAPSRHYTDVRRSSCPLGLITSCFSSLGLSAGFMIITSGSRIASHAVGDMGMEDQLPTLDIHMTGGSDADAEEVAEAILQLRRELLGLDVGAVQVPRAGNAPPGTRAVELAALGALVVSIAKPEVLADVVAAVRSWLSRSQHRSIKLVLDGDVLELSGVTSDEQRRLTDEWLRRHDSR